MKTEAQKLIEYLNEQFPATVGHLPLENKIRAVWQQGADDALDTASLLVLDHKWQKGSMNFNQGFMAGTIISHKSKNVAATPNAEFRNAARKASASKGNVQ